MLASKNSIAILLCIVLVTVVLRAYKRTSLNSEKESKNLTIFSENKLIKLGKPTESKLMKPLKMPSKTPDKP